MTANDNSVVRSEGGFGYTNSDYVFILSYATTKRNLSFNSLSTLKITIDGQTAYGDIILKNHGQMFINYTTVEVYAIGISLIKEDMVLFSSARDIKIDCGGVVFTLPSNTMVYINSLLNAVN